MENLLKTSLISYVGITIFIAILAILICLDLIRLIKKIKNKVLSVLLGIVLISVLTCAWLSFCYTTAYPVSLAYYEYKNNITQKINGAVDNITFDKDHVYIIVNNDKYTWVYSSKNQNTNIANSIVKGDTVWVRAGRNSNYIFEIEKVAKD